MPRIKSRLIATYQCNIFLLEKYIYYFQVKITERERERERIYRREILTFLAYDAFDGFRIQQFLYKVTFIQFFYGPDINTYWLSNGGERTK